MADKERPDDPYDLVQSNWPAESETAYDDLETDMTSLQTTALEQGGNAQTDGTTLSQDFLGETGSAVSGALTGLGRGLDGTADAARTAAAQCLTAATAIRAAKSAIRLTVKTANPLIADAKTAEEAGEEPEPSSDTLIKNARDAIEDTMTDYQTDMNAVTTALTALDVPTSPGSPSPAAPRAWRGPNRETAYSHDVTPERRDQIQQSNQYPDAVQHQPQPGQHDQPNISGHPGFTHPGTPSASAPAASAPSASTPSMSSPAGSPGGLGGNSGLGGPGTAGSPGGLDGLAQQGTGSPAGSTGLPGTGAPTGMPDIPALDAAATSGLTGLTALGSVGIYGLPAAGVTGLPGAASAASSATGGVPPSYPLATGTTPGAASPGSIAPFTPGMGGAVAPVTSVPSGTPGAGTPVTPPTAVPTPGGPGNPPPPGGPGGSAPERVGPRIDTTAVVQHLRQEAAARVAGDAGAPIVMPAEAQEGSFVRDLPEDQATAHTVLSSLRASFADAGWDQPLAVAVIRTKESEGVVYATADGLSAWPTGVSIPENVIPLDHLGSLTEGREWLGYNDPAAKLAGLRGVQVLLTTEPVEPGLDGENTLPVQQTPGQYREIVQAGDTPTAHVTRGADRTEAEAEHILATVLAVHPDVPDRETAAAALRAVRWADQQPENYVQVFVDHLVSEAVAAQADGDTGGAGYLARQAAQLLGIVIPNRSDEEGAA